MHEPAGDADGAVFFRPERLRGAIVHSDHFASVVNTDGQALPTRMMRIKLGAEHILAPNKNHLNWQMANRSQSSFDFRFWSVVATHRVDSDGHQGSWHRAV
jgi:hypothetical protein